MISDVVFDVFILKSLPYIFLKAVVYVLGLAFYIRWTKPKIR
jgi:hypothetical protein